MKGQSKLILHEELRVFFFLFCFYLLMINKGSPVYVAAILKPTDRPATDEQSATTQCNLKSEVAVAAQNDII